MIKFTDVANGEINHAEKTVENMSTTEAGLTLDEAKEYWDDVFEQRDEITLADILNKSESEFSFNFDIEDFKEILEQFKIDNWDIKTDSEKMDLVEELKDKICEKLGIENPPEIEFFEDDYSNCGFFYAPLNVFGINVCELKDPRELVNTIAHELRHAYQQMRAENPKTEMDNLYRANFAQYISPIFDEEGNCLFFTDYEGQLVEAEARAFAKLFDIGGNQA